MHQLFTVTANPTDTTSFFDVISVPYGGLPAAFSPQVAMPLLKMTVHFSFLVEVCSSSFLGEAVAFLSGSTLLFPHAWVALFVSREGFYRQMLLLLSIYPAMPLELFPPMTRLQANSVAGCIYRINRGSFVILCFFTPFLR